MDSGFLFIDKPKGLTSFDVVRKIKKVLNKKKVGHAGTLDPLATGLLMVAFGEATKFLEFMIGMDKTYEVEAYFGAVSDSYDADGAIEIINSDWRPEREVIEAVVKEKFLGEILQMPPKYSALKINGRKAYDLARSGEDFTLKERKIEIYKFSLSKIIDQSAFFEVSCSSGTYIRSLVHDLGQLLGVGAYVKELRRTRIGNFDISDAVALDSLDNKIDQSVISLEKISRFFPICDLSDEDFLYLKDGRILMNKKIDHNVEVAFHHGKCVGFLEMKGGGIKFKKRII